MLFDERDPFSRTLQDRVVFSKGSAVSEPVDVVIRYSEVAPATISGRAFAGEPKLLMADEPTGNLDVDTGRQVLQALRDVNQNENATVVLVTHNTSIAPMANRVVRLHNGVVDREETNPEPKSVADLAW